MLVTGAVEERRTGGPSAATATAWSILDDLGVQAVAGWPRPARGRSDVVRSEAPPRCGRTCSASSVWSVGPHMVWTSDQTQQGTR